MRFLQKSNRHQTDIASGCDQDQTRTQQGEAEQGREEEVSAHFKASDDPVSARIAALPQSLATTNHDPHTSGSIVEIVSENVQSQKALADSMIDLANTPSLGTASHGHNMQNKAHSISGDSYLTWSRSNAQPGTGGAKDGVQLRHPIPSGDESLARGPTNQHGDLGTTLRRSSWHDEGGVRLQADQTKEPNLAEAYHVQQAMDHKRRNIHTSASITILQSLPRPDPAVTQLYADETNVSERLLSASDGLAADYRTSDILMVDHDRLSRCRHDLAVEELSPKKTANTSSPISRLVREACEATVVRESPHQHHTPDSRTKAKYADLSGRLLTEHFCDWRQQRSSAPDHHARATSSRLGDFLVIPDPGLSPRRAEQHRFPPLSANGPVEDDSGTPDLIAEPAPPSLLIRDPRPPRRRPEELMIDQDRHATPGLYQMQAQIAGHELEPEPLLLANICRRSPAIDSRNRAYEAISLCNYATQRGSTDSLPLDASDIFTGQDVLVASESLVPDPSLILPSPRPSRDNDELAGFWRPQRLY